MILKNSALSFMPLTVKSVVLMVMLLSSGCASLSREECLYGDWFNVGLKDGRTGEEASQFVRHQDACQKYGIIPDKTQYLAGRQQGLQQYCQRDNAVELGLRGERYRSVCPLTMDRTLRYYNDAAYRVHQHKEALKILDNSLMAKEKDLFDKKLTDKERHQLRHEIRELDRRRQNLRNELYFSERQLERLLKEFSPPVLPLNQSDF